MADRVELYRAISLPGYNIPTSMMPAPVYHSVPTEEYFEWAVRKLRGHRSGVTSRMRTKDIR